MTRDFDDICREHEERRMKDMLGSDVAARGFFADLLRRAKTSRDAAEDAHEILTDDSMHEEIKKRKEG